jgi:iron-sulfur cluster repair protein YtfE (RIC family)
MTNYNHKLEEVRSKATDVCRLHGDDHDECLELQDSLSQLEQMEESIYEVMFMSLERYCADYPDAEECHLMPGGVRSLA